MKVRILRNQAGKVLAVETVSAPLQTVGVRRESGSLVAAADQQLQEMELYPDSAEKLVDLLSRLGVLAPVHE